MTKIITLLVLLLSFGVYSQNLVINDGYMGSTGVMETPTINLNLDMLESTKSIGYNEPTIPLGPVMLIGGSAMTLAGLLTVPPMRAPDFTEPKPFFQQGGRMLAITTGIVISTVGIVITISGE